MVKLVSLTPDPPSPPRRNQWNDWQAIVLNADGRPIQTNSPTDLLPNGVRPLCSCAQCNAIRDREMHSRLLSYVLPPLYSHL